MIASEAVAPARSRAAAPSRATFLRLDLGEWVLLILFSLVSVWLLALDLYQVIAHGLVWLGVDGPYPTDQFQYLAWVRSSSEHLLAANLFVIHGTPADYFQPAVVVSALLVKAGMAPWLSLMIWKPVAVIGTFIAVRAFARRALPDAGPGPWLAVIALTLFYGSFTTVFGSFGVLGDLWPGFWAWDYSYGLMALAAIIGALVIYASARREGRMSWWPGVLGALASILHPWQGELMVVTLILLEVFSAETREDLREVRSLRALGEKLVSPRVRLAFVSILLTAIPLLYYVALDKLDSSWGAGTHALKHSLSPLSILLVVLPLGLVALTGYRGKAGNFLIRTCRLWPVATIVIYLASGASAGGAPLHTFLGISLPLSVLAVDGCLRLGWRRLPFAAALAVLLVLLGTVPNSYWELKDGKYNTNPSLNNTDFITHGEQRALNYLARDPTPGGVLARLHLGKVVPELTSRHTYVGDCVWSLPNCPVRSAMAAQLIHARMTPAQSKHFVLSTQARFVLIDCEVHIKNHLIERLRPLIESVRQFGCASVYQIK